MNEYDSSKMQDVLNQAHASSKTENPEEADLIILNTCSVREKAEEKIYSHLGEYEALKKANPNLLIAIGGCVASQEGENILKRAPFVDLIFGPQTLHRLPDLVSKRRSAGLSQVDISFPEIENLIICLPPVSQVLQPWFQLLRVAANIVRSVLSLTREGKRSRDRLRMY